MSKKYFNSKFGPAAAIVLMGLSASGVYATGWCPTQSSNAITCSNCNIELTCSPTGTPIVIFGNNVVLDGQSHSMLYTNGTAITVYSPIVTIKNLAISHPGANGNFGYGILFQSTSGTGGSPQSHVQNVSIIGASGHGIANVGESEVIVENSTFNSNGMSGMVGVPGSPEHPEWGQMRSILSTADNNAGAGFYMDKGSALIHESYFDANQYGIILNSVGSSLHANTVRWNANHGIFLVGGWGDMVTNTAAGNGAWDCVDITSYGWTTGYMRVGNYYGSHYGLGCIP